MLTGKNIIVYYHGECTDGFASAFVIWLKYRYLADYVPIFYNSKIQDINYYKDKIVYVIDYSFSKEEMEKLIHNCKKFIFIDHHKTAIEMLKEMNYFNNIQNLNYFQFKNNKLDILIDISRSAALIAYEEYFGEDKNNLFHYIDDYDRYELKLKGTEQLNLYINTLAPYKFEDWEKLLKSDLSVYIEEGKYLERQLRVDVYNTIKNKTKCDIIFNDNSIYTGLAVNSNINMHVVGSALARESNTFGLIWRINKDCRVSCSFRSLGNYDTTEIATRLGGGGHAKSSGVTLPMEKFIKHISLKPF